jgi:large subunit ribosomal protein L21
MGYAVFATGGKQYRVSPGDVIEVERLDASGSLTFDEVLLVSDEDGVRVGQPTVDGASIEASVLEHFRGPKIRIFTYRASKRTRRRMGHRQELTRLRIDSISAQPVASPA